MLNRPLIKNPVGETFKQSYYLIQVWVNWYLKLMSVMNIIQMAIKVREVIVYALKYSNPTNNLVTVVCSYKKL